MNDLLHKSTEINFNVVFLSLAQIMNAQAHILRRFMDKASDTETEAMIEAMKDGAMKLQGLTKKRT